jgi:hypothetical protein
LNDVRILPKNFGDDVNSPFLWHPKYPDVLLITGYYALFKISDEERIMSDVSVGISHESLHQVIHKFEGKRASETIDMYNAQIEDWLGWPHIRWGR